MSTTKIDGPYLSTADLATYLRVSVATIRAWRLKGLGPSPVSPGGRGGRLVWRRADVDAWIDAQAASGRIA